MKNSFHLNNSQVFGHGYGYGGSIIEEEEEDVVFKHMVICKTEVRIHKVLKMKIQ